MAEGELGRIEPPIAINLNGNPGPIRFSEFSEVDTWVSEQIELVQKYFGGQPNYYQPLSNHVYSRHNHLLNEIKQHAQRGRDSADENTLANARSQVESFITNAYQTKALVHFDSADGRLIRQFIEEDDYGAALALFIHASGESNAKDLPQRNPITFLEASLRALLAQAGKGGVEVERKALQQLHIQYGDSLSEQHQSYENGISELQESAATAEKTIDDLEERQQQAETDAIGRIETVESDLNSRMEKFDLRLDNIESTFKERMSLAASESHWGKKRSRHLSSVRLSAFVFVSLIGGILVSIFLKAVPLFDTIVERIALVDAAANSLAVPAIVTLFIGVPLFLVIWLLRLVSRVFITNLVQHGDADDRVAMLSTYLSLVHEKKIEAEADRILILQALFRPSVVHAADDAAPPTAFDILLQRIRGEHT